MLDQDTDWTEFSELVTESYRLLAPKQLAALVDTPPRNSAAKRRPGTVAEAPPRDALLIPTAQSMFPSGPASTGKLRVLSACTPACCSPLNGVTFEPQPAFAASSGLLNQSPRWN